MNSDANSALDNEFRQAAAEFREAAALVPSAAATERFRKAASYYWRLERGGLGNTELYRNEGTAWLLAGDLPRAIWSFRRGLQLAPGDQDLLARLAYARGQVAQAAGTASGSSEPIRWRWPFRPIWLFLGASGLYALSWLMLGRWFITGSHRLRNGAAAALGVSLLMGAVLIREQRERIRDSEQPLIVLTQEVSLRRGNGTSYPFSPGPKLARGTEARALFQRGNWLQIDAGSERVGWVYRHSALVDRRIRTP
jgi:hypothetical protein